MVDDTLPGGELDEQVVFDHRNLAIAVRFDRLEDRGGGSILL